MAINNNDGWLVSVPEGDHISRIFHAVTDGIESEGFDRIVIRIMNRLYPTVEDKKNLLKLALDRRCLKMIKLIEAGNLKIHEVRFEDGQSALHYLAEVIYGRNDQPLSYEGNLKVLILKIIDYFLDNPENNYQDDLGYTYLHGACMSGNVTAVNLLLSQGVDVNLDTYTCSPLHIAAQYRHADVVEILLTHGANPNQRDVEQFTPLHALSRLCLCQCTDGNRFCDKRKPVDKLVQMLVDHGADIEARNCHGYTPLKLSVSRLDLELTRALLKYGAKLDNLNENKIFNMTFTPLELKNYPLTLNIIDMLHLLKSAGYTISLQERLRTIKYWMKIRGNDTDHLISDYTESSKIFNTDKIKRKIFFHHKYGFHLTQEAEGFLRQKCKELRKINPNDYHRFCPQEAIDDLTAQVERTKNIMLSENVSLYQICRMSYSEGYSVIKGIKNWRLPAMDDISCTYVNIIAKRHLANVLIRPHLEWFVADLFMTYRCKLHLPYLPCLKIAEHMSDEDLFRLCRRTKKNQLKSGPINQRKRCRNSESAASASSEPPIRRSRKSRGLPAMQDDQ